MLAVRGELISLIASDTRQEEPGSVAAGVRRLLGMEAASPAAHWLCRHQDADFTVLQDEGSSSSEPTGLCTGPSPQVLDPRSAPPCGTGGLGHSPGAPAVGWGGGSYGETWVCSWML